MQLEYKKKNTLQTLSEHEPSLDKFAAISGLMFLLCYNYVTFWEDRRNACLKKDHEFVRTNSDRNFSRVKLWCNWLFSLRSPISMSKLSNWRFRRLGFQILCYVSKTCFQRASSSRHHAESQHCDQLTCWDAMRKFHVFSCSSSNIFQIKT